MLISGVGAFVGTVWWVRNGELRERYAITWMGVAVTLLICGVFPDLIKRFADLFHLSYAAAALFITLAAMYVFSFTVSVSLTRQYRQNYHLTQEVGLLQQRLAELEARIPDRPADLTNPWGPTPEHGAEHAEALRSSVP